MGRSTKFYEIWKNMKQRCLSEKNPQYRNYGGRGITISQSWLHYPNFEEDMYDEYGYWFERNYGKRNIELTLDRIDNSKGYYKENCKWSSAKEQANNRRQRVKVGHLIKNHGTVSEYFNYKCRCLLCKEVASEYNRKKYEEKNTTRD